MHRGSRWIAPAASTIVAAVVAGAAIESNKHFFVDFSEFSKKRWSALRNMWDRVGILQNPEKKNGSEQMDRDNVQERESITANRVSLPLLTDELFESTDDLLVFMFASEGMMEEQRVRVDAIVTSFLAQQPHYQDLAKVRLFHSLVPPAHSASLIDTSRVELMSYKGQRKLRVSLSEAEAVPMDRLADFFKFRSTPVDEELKGCIVQHVSGDEFEKEVLHAATSDRPILVQLYEKSCFLCFLMRPFLNSLAPLVHDKVVIKRLDIEENDFPEGVPVVRGTPTFVLYPQRQRFEEFKPRDLVNRLCRDFEFDSSAKEVMNGLVDKVALRFQLFSGLVMWQTESEKLLDQLVEKSEKNEEEEKIIFNKIVAEFMADDMLRVDGIESNLETLKQELEEAEKQVLRLGQTLGEKV